VLECKIIEEINYLDTDYKHYTKRKSDLDNRLYKMYDKIEGLEKDLINTQAKKTIY
jgi:site-specific DNA recombinase